MLHRKPKVKIVVQESIGIKYYRAIEERSYPEGNSYTYKNYQKKIDYVVTPSNYIYSQIGEYKYVGKLAGNDSACPLLIGTHFGKPYWEDCPGINLSDFVADDVLARAGKTLTGKKQFPWMILICVIAVVIIAVVAFNFFKPQKTSEIIATTEEVR